MSYFVHGGKIVHVLEEHGGLYDVVEIGARSFENAFDILEDALGLLADVGACHFAGLRIERDLSR